MPTMSALIMPSSGHLSALEAGACFPLKGAGSWVREGRRRDVEKEFRWEGQLPRWVAGSPNTSSGR